MRIEGEGPAVVGVLWSLTALVTIILVLRAYVRVVIASAYGIDDQFFFATWVLMTGYATVATVATLNGYGRHDLSPEDTVWATYWRMIAQTFSLIATGASKASVGFFLLRLVVVRWQIISISIIMVIMGILSLLGAIFTWVACTPLEYAYDERIKGGHCFNTTIPAVMLAFSTILVDIYFAILPWIFVWKLNIARREKFTIAVSLSLGIFAAIAGAVRVFKVKGVRDVPPGVIIWSQVETAVTLVAVGIPVCRPLWSRTIGKWVTSRYYYNSNNSYRRQQEEDNNNNNNNNGGEDGSGGGHQRQHNNIGLRTIGGSAMPGGSSNTRATDSTAGTSTASSRAKRSFGKLRSQFTSFTTTEIDPTQEEEEEEEERARLRQAHTQRIDHDHQHHHHHHLHHTGTRVSGDNDDDHRHVEAAGPEVKRSWALGDTVTRTAAGRPSEEDVDEIEEETPSSTRSEHDVAPEGIVLTKTYKVTRG